MQRRLTGGRIALSLVGLALTLGLVLIHANQWGERFFGLTPLQSRDAFWWPILFVTLIYVVAVERRPLSSLGLRRPTWMTPVFGVAFALVLFALDPLSDLLIRVVHLQQQGGSAEHAIVVMPTWYKLVLVTRAALAEEVVFRGYAIERIEELTGSKTLAVAASVATFTAAHAAYWGWASLLGVAVGGLALALFYLWRRDLVACMLAHFIVDAWGLLA